MTHYVGSHGLVSLRGDPALTLRRSRLVNRLFKYAGDIRSLANGYAIRFLCSQDQDEQEELIGAIADYIIFESRNAPQLTFNVVEESDDKAFWLHVRGVRPEQPQVTSTAILSDTAVPYLT